MVKVYRTRKPVYKRRKTVTKSTNRRRLQPAAAAAAGAFIYYMGKKYYEGQRGYKQALAKKNKARQSANLQSAKNIVTLSAAGLSVGKSKPKSLKEKISEETNKPLYFRQTHAYKIDGDSGRMNWFHSPSLTGSTLLNMINKVKDSETDLDANPTITGPTVSFGSGVPQQFYKYDIDYNSVQYQLMNSSTNTLQGVIMWLKPKRELGAVFPSSTVPIKPVNIFALSIKSALPTQNNYNPTNYTQTYNATTGYNPLDASLNTDYSRGGNTGTTNNNNDNVMELDIGLKPSSACVSNIFEYYFDIVKSTDFDLSPGQQGEFWLKQHDCSILDYQALQYDSIPNMTMYCMIGIKGQMVGSNATTGDTKVVSTGSCQLSIIETHKTIVKAHSIKAPKIWNFVNDATETAPGGILSMIPDANQEIVNDETDGIDNTYNEVV